MLVCVQCRGGPTCSPTQPAAASASISTSTATRNGLHPSGAPCRAMRAVINPDRVRSIDSLGSNGAVSIRRVRRCRAFHVSAFLTPSSPGRTCPLTASPRLGSSRSPSRSAPPRHRSTAPRWTAPCLLALGRAHSAARSAHHFRGALRDRQQPRFRGARPSEGVGAARGAHGGSSGTRRVTNDAFNVRLEPSERRALHWPEVTAPRLISFSVAGRPLVRRPRPPH